MIRRPEYWPDDWKRLAMIGGAVAPLAWAWLWLMLAFAAALGDLQ